MSRTYIDAGVLIAAARGRAPMALRALEVLDDPTREFASSIFVKLEVLPKAIYYKNEPEAEFYEEFFSGVIHWANSYETLIEEAFKEASAVGLAALDALHVVSALSVGAEELVNPSLELIRQKGYERGADCN
jgi:predicted nucleic acid-binding protein